MIVNLQDLTGNIYTNNNGLQYEVIEYVGKSRWKVKFLESGCIRTARADKIKNGSVRDYETEKGKVYIGAIMKSNKGLSFEILRYIGNEYFELKFIESGYVCVADRSNIIHGSVRDYISDPKKVNVGDIHTNNHGLEFIVLEYIKDPMYKIKFIKSGYETVVQRSAINTGYIIDYENPSVLGIGVPCIPNYTSLYPKESSLWQSILLRCYNINDTSSYPRYGEKGVSVCERWHRFDNFLEDVHKIDGYDDFLFHTGKLHLDKDLKQYYLPYNKRVYSLDTCTFISPHINTILATKVNVSVYDNNVVIHKNKPIYSIRKFQPAYIVPAIILKQ